MKTSQLVVSFFAILMSHLIYAQPNEGQFINASIGIGYCSPDDESELSGSGFYAQAEYVWSPNRWFGVRPYAGVVFASGTSDEPGMTEYHIKSNAFMLGAKVRLAAPIPYVAPFFETGIGMSVGSFSTHTEFTNVKRSGALLHIPFTVGLAIGRRHNYELKFIYYYHEAAEQVSGAAAFGLTFPLGNN